MTEIETPKLQQWVIEEPWIQLKCGLGEAPWYNSETNLVRFVDINNSKLYTADLNAGQSSLKTYETDSPIGCTADIEGSPNKFLAGFKTGVGIFDLETGKSEMLAKFWDDEKDERFQTYRSNDGSIDPNARFLVSAFPDPLIKEPGPGSAYLFSFSPSGKLSILLSDLTLPNGIQWSLDNRTMYLSDTTTKIIWAYDYDNKTGAASNKRGWFQRDGEGMPGMMDGNAMDEEGCIWQAVFEGGKVIRISPEGKVVGEVKVPTRNVTCTGFAGSVLLISSAVDENEEEGEEAERSRRFGGSIFKLDVGIRGREKAKWRDLRERSSGLHAYKGEC